MVNAEDYRKKLLITHIRINNQHDSWAICPRCHSSIDREYMSFCSICGQHLDWSGYGKAEFVFWNEKIYINEIGDEQKSEKPCRHVNRQGLFRRILSKLCGLR